MTARDVLTPIKVIRYKGRDNAYRLARTQNGHEEPTDHRHPFAWNLIGI